jgi:hypothetical protein
LVCDIIRHIARQRKKPQVAIFHRTGDIMVERPAQLSRADCTSPIDFRALLYMCTRCRFDSSDNGKIIPNLELILKMTY